MLWDTARPYHYVRWTADRRLLLGGEDRPVKPGARRARSSPRDAQSCASISKSSSRPCATSASTRRGKGLFAMTPDSLPYIGPHRRYPRHAFALGYGGNGMTFAALAARILVEQWRGIASPDHALFAFNRGVLIFLPRIVREHRQLGPQHARAACRGRPRSSPAMSSANSLLGLLRPVFPIQLVWTSDGQMHMTRMPCGRRSACQHW